MARLKAGLKLRDVLMSMAGLMPMVGTTLTLRSLLY
jgi:hypothetical protein